MPLPELKMTDPIDRPNAVPWPPLIYGTAIAAGFVLQWLVPLPWAGGGALRIATAGLGLCLICIAIALDVAALVLFRRHKTTILPNRAADALITEGPFAKSRNPIYLGNTLLTFGLGLLFAAPWLLPLAFIAAIATQKLAIEREEHHLAAKFGSAWQQYAEKTPRWIGGL